jgi:hypothetical protein
LEQGSRGRAFSILLLLLSLLLLLLSMAPTLEWELAMALILRSTIMFSSSFTLSTTWRDWAEIGALTSRRECGACAVVGSNDEVLGTFSGGAMGRCRHRC